MGPSIRAPADPAEVAALVGKMLSWIGRVGHSDCVFRKRPLMGVSDTLQSCWQQLADGLNQRLHRQRLAKEPLTRIKRQLNWP